MIASSYSCWIFLYFTKSASWFIGKEQNGHGGAADGTVKEDCPTQGAASDVLSGGKSPGMRSVQSLFFFLGS